MHFEVIFFSKKRNKLLKSSARNKAEVYLGVVEEEKQRGSSLESNIDILGVKILEDGIQVTLKFKNIYHVIKEVFC
jgi:hypothetical protein